MAVQSSPADDRIIEVSDPRRGAPPRILLAVLIACAAGAVLGSAPLLDAARALPGGMIATALQTGATRWHRAMTAVGAAQPYACLRSGIRLFETWNAPS